VDAKLYRRRWKTVPPSGLWEFIFPVPVAYATGKYVSPSGLRDQAVIHGSGFALPAGNRPRKIFLKILGERPTPVSDNAFEL